MKGIKLTPFLLFVILLVVLVLAMLFGSTSKPVLENMANSGETSSWKPVLSNSIQAYNSGAQLDDIIPIKDGQVGIYYDPSNGNVVITNSLVSSEYTLLSRDSMGVATLVNNASDMSNKISNTVNLTTAPWTYIQDNMSLLYCPYKANTLIIVINNIDNTIMQVFKSSKGISNSLLPINTSTGVTNTVEAKQYTQLGQQVKEQITINGKNTEVTKIANNVYYNDTLGIAVGTQGTVFDVSKDFKTGLSKQNTDNILVMSCLVDESSLLIVVITKEPSTNVYKVASANYIKHSFSDGNPNDSFSLSFETQGDKESGSGSGSGSSDDGSQDSNSKNDSCNNQYNAKPSYVCPNKNNASGSDSDNNVCNSSDYIRKSEIVPPVCPGCPPCPTAASCTLSINSNGEIVDCTGKKYENANGILGASPATFGGFGTSVGNTISSAVGDVAGVANTGLTETGDVIKSGLNETGDVIKSGMGILAPTVDNTIDTAGDVVGKGLDTATGALDKTLDTAGGAFDKTLDTAGGAFDKTLDTAGDALNTTVDGATGIVGELGDTVGDIASGIGEGVGGIGQGIGQGVAGLGTGASDLVQGVSSDAASIGNNVIDSSADLLKSTGSGIMELSQQQQQMMQQQMMQNNPMQQQMMQNDPMQQQMMQQGYMQPGYMQPGYMQQPGYPMQMGYMQPGMGYSYPQTCQRESSNFMPITNDFSQFT
jgi:hypothetical protein